jgi:hypothetical protein
MKSTGRKQLELVPGVGKAISQHLWDIGIRSADDLKGRSAEQLYGRLCKLKGSAVDKCMLYTLRCAIYYASNTKHNRRLLKWYNWKNRKSPF